MTAMFLGSNSLHNLSYLGNSLDSMAHGLYGFEGIKSIKGNIVISLSVSSILFTVESTKQ